MNLEFRLLGDLAVLADGHPLELGGPRQRSVLALLILQRNRPVATELLADRLWPDDLPESAIKTVQVYVSRLRRALGPDAARITSSATGYRLSVTDDELDAARFERGLRQAREALAAGPAERSLAILEEALAQWSGPALGDLAERPFARHEADRLEELHLQAREEVFELRIGAGMGRETIDELRRLVGDEPGRERLWRLLMLALYADGRQAEALRAYQDAHRYMTKELGLDPGAELRELERAILSQAASLPTQRVFLGSVMRADPTEPGSTGRRTRRIVTVLRAEAVPPIDDDRLDPEILGTWESRVLEVVQHAVERHGGTIDQSGHDGITAVFGLTVAREDDPMRALRAALEMRDHAAADEVDPVIVRIGVATGQVLAGPKTGPGSALVGAPLQAAASLASQAQRREVLLTPETLRSIGGAASMEPMVFEAVDDRPSGSKVWRVIRTEGKPIAPPHRTPFVGRADQLGALLEAFERVASARMPALATVIGAPGVGKSRLAAESFVRMSGHARVLRSRCLPYGDGITYWPIRDLVLDASGIGNGESRADALAKLGTVLAGSDRADQVRARIASLVGLSDEPVPGEEIPWAVRRFFEALAAQRPLVLLVDDLQWAEPALLDVLEHVLTLGQGPILLVTVARPELEEARPDWLARPGASLVRLDALDVTDATKLLDHLAPEMPPGPVRERILATSEGNPLFVEQFVAFVADQAGGDEHGLDDRTESALPMPPTISLLLAARLDRLPEADRRVLECAAVVGRTFWAGALAELLPESELGGLPGRLAELIRRDLVRPDRSDVPDDEAYRFRHLLIRDAAYGAVPKRERAELHERFAGWLEGRAVGGSSAVGLIVGYHLEQAYRYRVELSDGVPAARQLAERALVFIAPAAQTALERGDAHAAVSLLRRAVDLCPPGRRRTELLIDLRSALRMTGDSAASDAVEAEILALLAHSSDEGLRHRHRLTEALFDLEGTTAEARSAFAYYERVGDGMGMIRALEVAFNENAGHGRSTTAIEILDEATDLALKIGRPDRAASFSSRSAWILPDSPIPIPQAIARCRRNLEMAGDDRQSSAMTLLALGELEARAGVGDQWRRHFDAAKVIIDDLGLVLPLGAAEYPISLADSELAAGDPARTVDLLCRSCANLDRLGEHSRLASMAPVTARTLLAVGRLDEVEHYAFWGRDIAHPEDVDAHVRWRIAISGLRSQQGRHAEAVALAAEAVALLAGRELLLSSALAQLTLAAALRADGDETAAAAAAMEARRFAQAKEDRAVLGTIAAFIAGRATKRKAVRGYRGPHEGRV